MHHEKPENQTRRRTPARLPPPWVLGMAGLVAALAASCSPDAIEPPVGGVPTIRVLLSDKLAKARITIRGPYRILLIGETEKPGELASGRDLRDRVVSAAGRDVIVDDLARTPCSVAFVPDGVPVELDGRRYRGLLRISVSPRTGKLQVINAVDLEGYTRGVVPVEAVPSWPAAALEAQAVAARTYGLFQILRRGDAPFHVRAGVTDQKYGGYEEETGRTDAAVEATAGRVLRYDGQPFCAFYHACCGGHTGDARYELDAEESPLRGVPCESCRKAAPKKLLAWTLRISCNELARRLKIPGLRGLRLGDEGPDGRIRSVTLYRAAGEPRALTGPRFRDRVGPGLGQLCSTRFRVKADGDHFVFYGSGWGHGVGMCQWGAKGMADEGGTARDILEKYYPGAEITKQY